VSEIFFPAAKIVLPRFQPTLIVDALQEMW
jgi:hypothetical protein